MSKEREARMKILLFLAAIDLLLIGFIAGGLVTGYKLAEASSPGNVPVSAHGQGIFYNHPQSTP
jgi:hypothetical protein